MALYKNVDIENPVTFPSGKAFQEYYSKNEIYAQNLLDTLFDPHRSLTETLQKYLLTIKSYLAGTENFVEFCSEVRKYDNSIVCGCSLTDAIFSYQCRTCAKHAYMSLCSNCFHSANHEGHDVHIFQSSISGLCDCGDTLIMNSNGFCKLHGPQRIPNQSIPKRLIQCLKIVFPRLMLRFIQHLRSRVSPISTYSTIENLTPLTSLFDLFDDLCNSGSIVRSIIIKSLIDNDLYTQYNDLRFACNLTTITYDVYVKKFNEITLLPIPIPFRTDNLSAYFDRKPAKCFLDELLFWFMQYRTPEQILKFILLLLSDNNFKYVFASSFLNLYGMFIEQKNTERITHITIQLFSNKDLTIHCLKEYHLMEIILSSFYLIFSNKNDNYKLLTSDFIIILSHEHVVQYFLKEKKYFIIWIQILSWFQGINMNQLEKSHENDLFLFTIENECFASVLWTIISHIIQLNDSKITIQVINRLFMALQQWLSSIDIEQYTKCQDHRISYTIPLHRYLSILTYISINYQDTQLQTLFPLENETFLLNLAVFPLKLQTIKYKINANKFSFNDTYELQRNQSNMHTNSCSYMNDADIYFLQLISRLVNMNSFMEMFFKNFYIDQWLVQKPILNFEFDQSTCTSLLEGSLIILALIVAFSPHLGSNDFERIRAEIINELAMKNCTYSYIESRGFSTINYDFKSILNDIAEYVEPNVELFTDPEQGQYRIKSYLWENEFDPLHILSRINQRQSFEITMQRYSEWIKSTNHFTYETNLWPPYRLHKPKDQFQENSKCILQSRYFHGILFSMCYKMINEMTIDENILSLVVYLCEFAIDDLYYRLKYGQFLDDYSPSTIQSSQCYTRTGINQSILTKISLVLNDDDDDDDDDKQKYECSRNTMISPTIAHNQYSVSRKNSDDLENSYGHHIVKFDEISAYEQIIQRRWDNILLPNDDGSTLDKHTSPLISSCKPKTQLDINFHCKLKNDKISDIQTENCEHTNTILDGKYETFYDEDNLLINIHKIIDSIQFQTEELNIFDEECFSYDQSSNNNLRTIATQTNSNIKIEIKSINLSLIQIFVHLLYKIVSNINEKNSTCLSLNDFLNKIRMKNVFNKFGDGTFYIARLLVKFEKLSDQCRTQIKQLVEQLDKKMICKTTDNSVNEKQNISNITDNDPCDNIKCCLCQVNDETKPLGIVVNLFNSNVIGIRETNGNLNCTQFYKEKMHSMLEIYSQESVLKSISNNWKNGIVIHSSDCFVHLICYEQYLKSSKILNNEQLNRTFSQTSTAILFKRIISEQIELDENIVETLTNLIVENRKPCTDISVLIAKYLTNFLEQLYLMIDKIPSVPNDDIIVSFLLSTLRFNLEHDLHIRNTPDIDERIINRNSCFRDLFYAFAFKYPFLSDSSHISLWYRITGLKNRNLQTSSESFTDRKSVPLIICDPIILLLRIMLNLSGLLSQKFYRIIVQALFNLTYIQALFTIINEMNKSERETLCSTLANESNSSMATYFRFISHKLMEKNFYFESNTNSKIWSVKSIYSTIKQRCDHFIKIAALIQHHLYQPIQWWFSSHRIEFEILWINLIKELRLYNCGEPYWFCNNSLNLIEIWLDELIQINKLNSVLTRQIIGPVPLFNSANFIELPHLYSDLLQSYYCHRCSYCQKLIDQPKLCLICGYIFSQKQFDRTCCDEQKKSIKQHLATCSYGSIVLIDINSTRTLIQYQQYYSYWASVYLDQHGEEDCYLRRSRMLYLNKDRLKLLYSAWISSNLNQLVHQWSIDRYHL